jgi:hypothetical protein
MIAPDRTVGKTQQMLMDGANRQPGDERPLTQQMILPARLRRFWPPESRFR